MKKSLFSFISFSLVLVLLTAFLFIKKRGSAKVNGSITTSAIVPIAVAKKISGYAEQAKTYVARNKLNTSLCILVDMTIASGKNRLFLYDLTNDSILDQALVTHGRCNEAWLLGRKYGNQVGCGCTSLGRYKIGNAYHGRFGLAYKLIGLDTTNNNAFKRFVVLHSHECVPEGEVDPAPICQSDGCPTVSKQQLKKLAAVIDASSNPLLLWIYD